MVLRAVIDTNVLVAGLRRRGPPGAVVDAWVERRFMPCVSTALALEYAEVLGRKLGSRGEASAPKVVQALLQRSEYVPIRFTYRPSSPDPGDDLVVDCVLNSGAVLVTSNVRDFQRPAGEHGFRILEADEFLTLIDKESPS